VSWQQRLQAIEGMTRESATEIGVAAAEALEVWLAEQPEVEPRDFVRALDEATRQLTDRKPATAPLHNLRYRMVQFAAEMLREGVPLGQMREELRDWLRGYRTHVAESHARIAHHGAEALAECEVVLTLSYSRTVYAVLEELYQHNPDLSVVVFEARPYLEGRRMAEALAQLGISVTLTVDAAMGYYMDVASAVLTGAEAVSLEGSFVNKVGTRPLMTCAHAHGVPSYVATETVKILPPTLRGELVTTVVGNPEDLASGWSPPEGVELSTVLYESTPDRLVTAYITEEGVVSPVRLATLSRPLGV
jgi:translation initiation factor 2B subunit (eIF-2B alpha/beta/delta family)